MDLSQQLAAITLYKDQWLWVLNKPSGLLSVNAKNATKLNLLSQLRLVHKQTSVVHRLDEPTSGVIVYALDKSVEAALQAQFRQQRVRKRYLAVVSGQMCATTRGRFACHYITIGRGVQDKKFATPAANRVAPAGS